MRMLRSTIHATAAAAAAALAMALPAPAAAQGAAAAAAPLAAQGCIGCHGPNGAGMPPVMGIAGRPAAETEAILRAFRADQRPGTIMGRIARGYTEAEIAALAAHFAAQPAATR
jgi:cytochrome subunit of sulfide dehydrogenase